MPSGPAELDSSSVRTALRSQVEQRMGRNLLRYQAVEVRLKAALPLRRLHISAEGLATLERTVQEQGRWSLGQLMPEYQEAFETYTAEAKQLFQDQLKAFVWARNQLVHTLLQEYKFLTTAEACEACIAQLDEDYSLAEGIARQVLELHRFVVQSIQAFLEDWSKSEASPSGMLDMMKRHATRLKELHGPEVQVAIEIPLTAVMSEIMAAIERSHAGEHGWVAFNRVGAELRKQYNGAPRVTLAVARQLDHYEFAERPARKGAGLTWMYRRRASSD